MTQKTLKFDLPVQAVDVIGNALAQLPYGQVKDLIDLLVKQANDPAIQAMKTPDPVVTEETPDGPA